MQISRRKMMGWMGGGAGLPFFLSCRNDPATVSGRTWDHKGFPAPADHAPDPLTDQVFPMSVCSGDPSETGVILWTRIDPARCDGLTDLTFQVGEQPDFATPLKPTPGPDLLCSEPCASAARSRNWNRFGSKLRSPAASPSRRRRYPGTSHPDIPERVAPSPGYRPLPP